MATQRISTNSAPLVRRALQSDGIFSAACGLVLALDAGAISAFVGLDSPALILVLGLALIPYGLGLFYLASSRAIEPRFPVTVIVLNIAWIVASILLLIADPFTFTSEGKWAVLLLADVVAVLGIWEFIALRRMH